MQLKSPIISRICIYALVIAIILPCGILIDYIIIRAGRVEPAVPFGNVMSEYFYFVNTNQTKHNLVAKRLVDATKISDPELADFYAKLHWTARNELITNYDSCGDSTWHSKNLDGSTRENFLNYWQTIRPQIREYYQQNLTPVEIKVPVVHFRCSDIPFIKHLQYHLPKASSVKWMANEIKKQGWNEIVFLNCTAHKTRNKTACQQYTDYYTSIFNAAGIKVTKQCNSILQDFALMVYSPLLVSLNPSSFSFMAGISKDPAQYISCNMGMEIRSGYYALQTEADWILDPQAPLLHNEVESYAEADSVITKLQSY